jgi:hypothetical protein
MAMSLSAEYTSSCYAATAHVRTIYPILQGKHSVDVAVVGAGNDVLSI